MPRLGGSGFAFGRALGRRAGDPAAVAGASGVYYAFFACFFIVVVVVRAAIRDRNVRVVVAGAALVSVVALVVLMQMVPTLVYTSEHGADPAVVQRSPFEAEMYGLRITQLLLPIDGHRVPFMAQMRATYRQGASGTQHGSQQRVQHGCAGPCRLGGLARLAIRTPFRVATGKATRRPARPGASQPWAP